MVHEQDVIRIYRNLLDHGVQLWLTGGWGIDALLGEQTRPHKDLDVLMLLDDGGRTRELLSRDGYSLKELWIENRWIKNGNGVETATAFVLWDSEGREFDAHAMRLNDQGDGVPSWDEAEGLTFTRHDLAGQGTIAGVAVKCLSPEAQMRFHEGYQLPDAHLRDLELLHKKLGVALPDGLSHHKASGE